MTIRAEDVKKLRELTGIGVMACKRALQDASGDFDEAMAILRKQGIEIADKKKSRATKEGRIGSYVHTNSKIGVLVELQCETDFVARNEGFHELLRDLCMQVCATDPVVVKKENLTEEVLDKRKKEIDEEAQAEPEDKRDEFKQERLAEFIQSSCLLEQPFIKDPSITITQRIEGVVAQLKENIQVSRFVRFEVGRDED